MESPYAAYAFGYLIVLITITTYVARRLDLLPERIGKILSVTLAVALIVVVSAILGAGFIYYSSRLQKQAQQLNSKEEEGKKLAGALDQLRDAYRQLQEQSRSTTGATYIKPPIDCPALKPVKAKTCTEEKRNSSRNWYLATAWNSYGQGKDDQNIFNRGVWEFVDRVQKASENRLIIHICTLDALKEANGGVEPNAEDILTYIRDKDIFQMVHASPSYWGKTIPGAEIINTVPFGMTTRGTDAWLASGGLQAWQGSGSKVTLCL